MSKMLSKMNLISVVQQLPKEDIETIQGYVEMIEDENQELKQKYENAVADYETTMFEKEQLNSLVNSCQEEIKRLKKQLEENKDNYNCLLKQKEQFEYIMSKQVDYRGQQKEFIEYLENEIYSFELRGTSPEYNFENVLKRILLKYKEIIGDDKQWEQTTMQ